MTLDVNLDIVGIAGDCRSMPAVGARCHELRIKDRDTDWRLLFRVDADAVVILEVFKKKTRRTPKAVPDTCRRRLANLRLGLTETDVRGPMDRTKKKNLEKAGWKVGSAADFLDLSGREAELIEMRHQLAKGLRELRRERNLTQTALADLLGSSQSRVAKMEGADESVSLDLLVKAHLRLGRTRREIGRTLAR